MKLFIALVISLVSVSVKADLFNAYFNTGNPVTLLPAGYSEQSTEPYLQDFTRYKLIYISKGSGRKRLTVGDYVVILERKETYPNYQYLRLNPKRLQSVIPGGIYKYWDRTVCNTKMPVVINYYDDQKTLIRSAAFNFYSVPDNQWHDLSFKHVIPGGIHFISIFRAIGPVTDLYGVCTISSVHNLRAWSG